jgi:hypothetical protein
VQTGGRRDEKRAPVTLFKGAIRSDISASDMFQPDLLSTFDFAL